MAFNPFGAALSTAVSTAMAAGQAAAAAKKNNSTSKGSSSSMGTSGGSATPSNQITYRDLDGNSYTGFLKDGVTYQDAAMTKPVSSNSVVNTAGGTYLKTDAGSLKAGTPEYDAYVANYMAKKNQPEVGNYDDLVRELEAASLQSSLNALKSAYDKNVSTLQAEQDKLAPMYQNARNQEAADSALSRQRFNETAAAYGLNTGTAGQANLSYATQLQSDLSALQAAETAANQEIERQRSDLAVQYQNAIAQAKADNNMQLAQQLYQEAIRREEALQQQSQYNSQMSMQWYQTMLDKYNQDRSYDYTVSQNQREDALNAAALAAQLGDYSKYGELYGWDDAFTQQMNQKYAAAMAAKNSGGGSGGGYTAPKTGESGGDYDALFSAARESGYPESFISNNYKRYGFTSLSGLEENYYTWSANNPEKPKISNGYVPVADLNKETGMNDSYFNAFANSVSAQLAGGKNDAALSNFESNWNNLSPAQRSQMVALLQRYGISYVGG